MDIPPPSIADRIKYVINERPPVPGRTIAELMKDDSLMEVESDEEEKPTPSHLRCRFEGGDGGSCVIKLLWEEAPKTCRAVVDMLNSDGFTRVEALHGRNSGGEALFLTRPCVALGDENTTLEYALGDFLFGYEPAGCCEHAKRDASEVAWIYHAAARPRRWVSRDGDAANATPPFETTDVPLNLWAKVESEEGFYAASGALPRSGARGMVMERVDIPKMRVRDDYYYYSMALDEARWGLHEGGIPIGACLVSEDGEILGRGRNRRVQTGSCIRHAEMDAIENAGRLSPEVYKTCTLYTTLTPCEMCAGAALLYGIPKIVIGDSTNFDAYLRSEAYLRTKLVELRLLHDEYTIKMFGDWCENHPKLWGEDIGLSEPAIKKKLKIKIKVKDPAKPIALSARPPPLDS